MSDARAFPLAVPVLSGDRVALREAAEDDLPAWFARATDAESAALAGDPIPTSPEAGFDWLRRHRQRFRERTGIRWVIVPHGSTRSVGSIGLSIEAGTAGVAELGFVVGRDDWGRGFATAAARLVVRFAFETLALTGLRAELLAVNVASRRVLEKVGFRLDAVIPDFERTDAGPLEGRRYVLSPPCAARVGSSSVDESVAAVPRPSRLPRTP